MKITIIGAKGMLGSELSRVLGSTHDVVTLDIEEIDITDRSQTYEVLKEIKPELIVNSAVFIDVELCETQPDRAWMVNAVGSQNVALAARKLESRVVYISSDYIFDGNTTTDYDEVSLPNPINQYGRSKLAGELLTLQNCARTYIVRTSWLFGHRRDNYVDRVLQQADKNGVVRMAEDQLEAPTYTGHLAQASAHLIETGAYGIYNISGGEGCTRAEFAKYVLECAGRSEVVEVIDTSQIKRAAKRPARVVLDCRLYRLVTGKSLPSWREGVKAYLARENVYTT